MKAKLHSSGDSLQRTSDLLRRLIQVPKTELKEEEVKYESERNKLKNRPGRKPKRAN